MARKLCPACKTVNAGSATSCSCGHAFAESSIVAARRTTKRCPACKNEQPRLLMTCGCGHTFENIVALRAEIVGRVHVAWSYVAIGLVLLAACAGIAIATSGMWILGGFGGLVMTLTGLMRRADARVALRDIDDSAGALPSATVRR